MVLNRIIKFIGNKLSKKRQGLKLLILIFGVFTGITTMYAQYPWPVEPKHESQELTATFCEFRDTESSDHFHNGIDIPKADGSPVFPVESGTITSIQRSGTNAYVRVGRYAYVHITPNPNLDVSDPVVAGQTVLGTILAGQGHLHFTDGYYDSEINAIRNGGGLTPYLDPWKPIIRYVKFYEDQSEREFPSQKVSGRVDIIVKVEEQNGPPTAAASRLNNGTFELGYKILTADADSVVFEPPNSGLRFRFTNKPADSYVHNVYFKLLSSTSSHVYTVTNQVTRNDYWDTAKLPVGHYTVMIFTRDTRQNADTLLVPVEVQRQDSTPPAAPVLKSVRRCEGGFQISWYPNSEPDLAGYRLYYSSDNLNWRLRYNENQLSVDSTKATFKTYLSNPIYFRLNAVDNASVPNISPESDIYGIKMREGFDRGEALIVDGFDRNEDSGAWHLPGHAFAFDYGEAIAENQLSFDMCSNDAILDGTVRLEDYYGVFWFIGDEAEKDETFSAAEQQFIRNYLVNRNGSIFISGVNIAWDLDLDSDCYSTTPGDNEFLNEIMLADFAGKIGMNNRIIGQGWFSGFEFSLDSKIYAADSLDIITPISPADVCLTYDSLKVAGICEIGHPGKLIYFAFPFEIIAEASMRASVMKSIITYLFIIDRVEPGDAKENLNKPAKFYLDQNYPNPFCPTTRIRYQIPHAGRATLKIYNIIGQLIATIEEKQLTAGTFEAAWDGRDELGIAVPSGVYFYILALDGMELAKRKMILIR